MARAGETCVEFIGNLYDRNKKGDVVPGFDVATRVAHVIKSCGWKKRRTRQWFNYRVSGSRKV